MSHWAILLPAGLLAGVIGSAGGITSLVAFGALVAVGLSPLAANVTNSVALVASGAGGAISSLPDVSGHGETIRRWLPVMIGFSAVGAVLVVAVPAGVFDHAVPLLVAVGALTLLLQPRIAAMLDRRGVAAKPRAILVLGAAVALYNGYFGAGSGILLIVLLLLSADPVLHRANALKNVIVVIADLLPAVVFAISGHVVWHDVWPLSAGALVGGLIGPRLARRLHPDVMRVAIALSGFGFAVWLAFNP